jgi:cytochrome-b5 reductase
MRKKLPQLSPLVHVLALDNAMTYRPYTPVNLPCSDHFDLLVKRYPSGRLSSFIHRLQLGEDMEFVPVLSHFNYHPNRYQNLGMIAGGTGIAPMIQLIRAVFANPQDHTRVSLVYACHSSEETYFRADLDSLAQQFPERLRISYVWASTRIDKSILKSHFLAEPTSSILVSGPPEMVSSLCGPGSKDGVEQAKQPPLKGLLKELGFSDSSVWRL